MKKRKLWLSCILLLFRTLKKLTRKKDQTETVYAITFPLTDEETKKQILPAEKASREISALLQEFGCPFTEYKTYQTDGKTQEDSRDAVTFFLMMLTDDKAEEIIEAVKEKLNLKIAFCTKEEHSYRELKKRLVD
ncbi:MAG: hypothetical protein IJF61_05350 [Clostridia bacterium]|nr:hypothetical protein [Clostridia bacterium]